MKRNIYQYEKNEYHKINQLIKLNNSERFFKKVNAITNKNKSSIDVSLNKLHGHYYGILNKLLNVDTENSEQLRKDLLSKGIYTATLFKKVKILF